MPLLTLHHNDSQFPIRLERFRIKGAFSLENYFVIFQRHHAGSWEIQFWIGPQADMRLPEELVERAYRHYPDEVNGCPMAYGTLNAEKCHFLKSYFSREEDIPYII